MPLPTQKNVQFLVATRAVVSCPDRFFSLMVGREKKGLVQCQLFFCAGIHPWLLIGVNEDFLEVTNYY